eukprot:Polyplicarium_translucidae@DN3265_c0_g2_i4.p1
MKPYKRSQQASMHQGSMHQANMPQNSHPASMHNASRSNKVHGAIRDPVPAMPRSFRRRDYELGRKLGEGSFGTVMEARDPRTGAVVAIKKVLQDPRYKNRELDLMKELSHINVVTLLDYYYTDELYLEKNGFEERPGRFLNIVMEYVPESAYRVVKNYTMYNMHIPLVLVKCYTYQMCRAVGYVHAVGLCHRDMKPHNLLIDPQYHSVKLCDFGSAKRLAPGAPSVAYICSRYYRAPELMLGSTEYTTAVDLWSIGCVLGELLLGKALFPGKSSLDQLVRIIQVLGVPTKKQAHAMNPFSEDVQFPEVKPRTLAAVFHDTPPDGVAILEGFLRYDPTERITASEALSHAFFDELFDPNLRLPPNDAVPPDFLGFSELELNSMSDAAKEIMMKREKAFSDALARLPEPRQPQNLAPYTSFFPSLGTMPHGYF